MNKQRQDNFWSTGMVQLTLATLCLSTSGALGRSVLLPVPLTISLRALFALVLVYGFCRWRGLSLLLRREDRWLIWGAGALFAAHWLTYFYALQLSSVAIGMLSLFTYPIITALLEPLFLGTTFRPSHLFIGLLVLVGLYFLAPSATVTSGNELKAIGFGLLSALVYAIRNLIMKSRTDHYHGSVLMMHQLLVTSLLLLPILGRFELAPAVSYWSQILLLALVTTALGHTLFVFSFRYFSATTTSIFSCLQPVFGILLGVLFLREYPGARTLLGGGLILSAVVLESWRMRRSKGD